jgi:hypothetical protein
MVLQDLFDELATGEFSNLAIGNSINGSIEPDAYKKVVTQVNAGLRELYKRFLLKDKICYITRPTGTTNYFLRDVNVVASFGDAPTAETPITVSVESITEKPTVSDLCRVIDVFGDGIDETTVYLNDNRRPDGVFTHGHDHISIKNPLPVVLGVVYQAYYPRIILTELFDPETYNLYYPEYLSYALKCYVASELFTGKTSKATEGEAQIYNTFHGKFEKACKLIEDRGFAEEVNTEDTKFEDGGWA